MGKGYSKNKKPKDDAPSENTSLSGVKKKSTSPVSKIFSAAKGKSKGYEGISDNKNNPDKDRGPGSGFGSGYGTANS